MGRPRKPLELHKMQGTRRADRHGVATVPAERVVFNPLPPEHLGNIAREHWETLAPICVRMGTLTLGDMLGFERMCMCYQEIRDCTDALATLGDTVYETTSHAGGYMRRSHPEVAQRSDAERRYLAYLGQFGLTPAARARLAVPAKSAAEDPAAKFFGGQ